MHVVDKRHYKMTLTTEFVTGLDLDRLTQTARLLRPH